MSNEKSGIFSFCWAKAEPSHVAAATTASTALAVRLIPCSAERLVAGQPRIGRIRFGDGHLLVINAVNRFNTPSEIARRRKVRRGRCALTAAQLAWRRSPGPRLARRHRAAGFRGNSREIV